MNLTHSLVVKCPHCNGKKKLLQLKSGNTFNSHLWSDTKQIAPMLPRLSPIQKCPSCGGYYLLSRIENKNKSTGDGWSLETGWLAFDEAVEAYNGFDSLSEDELSTVGIAVIWAYNDIIRGGKEPTASQQEVFKKLLANLLNNPDFFGDNHLLRAELYRELGDFEKCISILENFSADNDFVKELVENIIEKAKSSDSVLFMIY